MLIATFNDTTGWTGKSITYEDGQFVLEGHGTIRAVDVMGYDREGHLLWANDWWRSMVMSKAPPTLCAAPAPPSAATSAAPLAQTFQRAKLLETYKVFYPGGHPSYPKQKTAEIKLEAQFASWSQAQGPGGREG